MATTMTTGPPASDKYYPSPPDYDAEQKYVENKIHELGDRVAGAAARAFPDAVADQSSENVGYCRVHENVYIGSQGTSTAVAAGTLSKFGAVFNVSGSEALNEYSELFDGEPFSLHAEHAARGVEYDTIQDENGFVLYDGRAERGMSGTELADYFTASAGQINPVLVAKYPRDIWLGTRSFMHPEFFLHAMYLAADRIDRLANRRADRNVLVNCFYGQNRSGAAVVAWLVLKRGFSCDDAIALLRKREREDRGDVDTPQKTLRNANFVALLHELSAASRVAHDRAYAEQYAEFKNELASRGFWFVGGVPMSRQKPVARPGNLTGEQFGCRTFFAAAPVESAGRACKWLSREAAGRACRWCGAVDAPMFWCSGCGTTATYCSRRCQALHLVAHAREDGCRGATRVLRSRRY